MQTSTRYTALIIGLVVLTLGFTLLALDLTKNHLSLND